MRVALRGLLFALVCGLAVGSAFAQGGTKRGQSAGAKGESVKSVEASGSRGEALTLQNFIHLLAEADESVLVQRLEAEIADHKLKGAEALYEPTLSMGVSRDQSYVLNSASEILQRASQVEYRSRVDQYTTAIGMKVPTGADIEASYNVSRIVNSLQPIVGTVSPEYRAYMGVKLTQPLLRGAGDDVTTSAVQMAEQDKSIAREVVRQVLAQRLVEGVGAYFNVQRARERVRLRQHSADIAQRLAQELRRQERSGQRSEGEALDAESSATQRMASVTQAQQDYEEQVNTFQSMISARVREQGRALAARLYSTADPLRLLPIPADLADVGRRMADRTLSDTGTEGSLPSSPEPEVLTTSLSRRPESRINQLRIARETIAERFAEDQTLPELNLVARYGLEDLSNDPRYRYPQHYFEADKAKYNSWSVGVQLKIGIFGDIKREADLSQAKLRRQQAELAQSAVQQRIANEIVSSVSVLEKTLQLVKRQREALASQKSLLEIEAKLAGGGKHSSIDVMKRQLDLLAEEEALVDAIALANRASFIVSQAQGLVLSRVGLE